MAGYIGKELVTRDSDNFPIGVYGHTQRSRLAQNNKWPYYGIIDRSVDLSSYPNVIYVDDTNGDDSTGDGSESSPYKTWYKAHTESSNGDCVYFLEGSYIVDWSNAYVNRTGERTLLMIEKNIDLIGNGNTTKIILDADGVVSRAHGINCLGSANIYQIQFEYVNYSSTSNYETDLVGGYSPTAGNLKIYNCALINRSGAGILDDTGNNSTLEFNNCTIIGEDQQIDCYHGDPTWTNCDFQYANPNYGTTSTCNVETTNQMTESEWRSYLESVPTDCENNGTGTNPDGSQAHIGVYGGDYAWEKNEGYIL